LYDPDRVREPLRRDVNGAFKPVSWKEALDAVAEALSVASKTGKETAFLTKPVTGSAVSLIEEFGGKVRGSTHTVFYPNEEVVQQTAAEHVFGAGSRVSYDFSLPNVIVSFGAGFLETWLSPVEYIKAFTANRVPGRDGK